MTGVFQDRHPAVEKGAAGESDQTADADMSYWLGKLQLRETGGKLLTRTVHGKREA